MSTVPDQTGPRSSRQGWRVPGTGPGPESRSAPGGWRTGLQAVGEGFLIHLSLSGYGPAALLIMTVAGGAAAVSGEPQRVYNTQGQDFGEHFIASLRTGTHTSADAENLLGHPQTKTFTHGSEEWACRYYVPPSVLRPGMEKVLTIRFQEGKTQEVRYSIGAL